MSRAAGTRIDGYEIVEHVADGAQAEVYRARAVDSEAEVALRFPHARVLDHPVLAARWRRELHLMEALSHPHVQCRLDVGRPHSEPYVVVEYAGGGSLDRWISDGMAPLPVGQALIWGRQLAVALAYLHHLGIVHRDLKPANVLVTADLEVKLADFGAALFVPKVRRFWTLPTPPEGTPEYLSPEQILGSPGDQRSDIYGWGIVMYELLSGHVPFTGPDPEAAMAAHLVNHPVPLRDLRPDVPPGLEAIVLTALRRRPERRYPTALALLDDLDRCDTLDPAGFDLRPEAPMAGGFGQGEGRAVLRFVAVVAATFVALVSTIVALTVALR